MLFITQKKGSSYNNQFTMERSYMLGCLGHYRSGVKKHISILEDLRHTPKHNIVRTECQKRTAEGEMS